LGQVRGIVPALPGAGKAAPDNQRRSRTYTAPGPPS
jgi:hypothetical protein